MTDTLFTDTNTEPQLDPNKNYWDELTGEGKKFDKTKYTSDDDLKQAIGRGKFEADEFIRFKNQEFDKLREDYLQLKTEYQAGPKLQELIDRLTKQQDTSSEQPDANGLNEKPSINPEDIEKLVSSKLMEHEANRKYEENFNFIKGKLTQKYGTNYAEVLKDQIDELGLTQEYVNELARKHPKVLLKTLGLDEASKQELFQTPVRSQTSFTPKLPVKRTWMYYENLRKTKPDQYWQANTQLQMHRDQAELGNEFKDGTYNALG